MKFTLFYQASRYIRLKKTQRTMKSWDQQNSFIRPLHNEVPLYGSISQTIITFNTVLEMTQVLSQIS